MKKILSILLILICLLLFSSCEDYTSTTFKLPNLEGMYRDNIKTLLDNNGLTYNFKFYYDEICEEKDYGKFVKYSDGIKAGDEIEKSKFFYVYINVLPLTFHNHEKCILEEDYEGKSFINDGIGKVRIARYVDGDTVHFYDSTGEYFKLRFLCIDTPESTIDHDPWGNAASAFTKQYLMKAKEIVLESEPTNKMDIYGRYLGYVWADGVLLNLVLVEEAYTVASAANSKYKKYFIEASLQAKLTGRRVYGEIDPDYDYVRGDFK